MVLSLMELSLFVVGYTIYIILGARFVYRFNCACDQKFLDTEPSEHLFMIVGIIFWPVLAIVAAFYND